MLAGDDFEAVSSLLKSARLSCRDFSNAISFSRSGDFVYCDPPYTVKHENNGFVKYNEKIFTWSDQERLASSLDRADKRGVLFAVSNAKHKSIIDLYARYKIREVNRASIISGQAKGRGTYPEVLITNY
ncbi:hypothetical protein GCM10010960_18090 [Arenimonas maotaiensis]|uniref:site-specific DNA-methyltransferase (adenine-specific) n=1 Tax=Arenimonas maotaiensis TaxID=1446479 RepID=A0A917FQ10_9GAMM|nr:hypothetical protein GCM10010960_18090 [Arenimonas maotaiensis]